MSRTNKKFVDFMKSPINNGIKNKRLSVILLRWKKFFVLVLFKLARCIRKTQKYTIVDRKYKRKKKEIVEIVAN